MSKNDLEETAEAFLRHLAAIGYSKETIIGYRRILKFFRGYLADKKISSFNKVTSDLIFSYQDYIHHEYKPLRGKKMLSLGYQANLLKVLKVLFRYLVREGKMLSDPAANLSMPKLPRRLPRNILTKREVRRILAAPDTSTLRGFQARTAFEILYSTGIRRSELRNLKVYDLNLTSREMIIRHGKGGKDRIIPITKKASEVIERYIKDYRPRLLRENAADPEYLFLNDAGKQIGQCWIQRMVRKYAEACKIKKHITTHTFRHTFATHLLRNKASIRVIQELLGHESLDSTQIYTKVEISDLRRVIDKSHPREEME